MGKDIRVLLGFRFFFLTIFFLHLCTVLPTGTPSRNITSSAAIQHIYLLGARVHHDFRTWYFFCKIIWYYPIVRYVLLDSPAVRSRALLRVRSFRSANPAGEPPPPEPFYGGNRGLSFITLTFLSLSPAAAAAAAAAAVAAAAVAAAALLSVTLSTQEAEGEGPP